ncbi:hypothetical protein Dimus_002197 [Dionaea muscipula]
MEAQKVTRKRKPQQQLRREGSVVTRSKFRSDSHHNAVIHCCLPDRRRWTRRSSSRGSLFCSGEDEISQISIKDLRARRVFSQPMVDCDAGSQVNGDGDAKKDGEEIDLGVAYDLKKEGLIGQNPKSSILAVGFSGIEDAEMRCDDRNRDLSSEGSGNVGFHDLKLRGNEECGIEAELNIQTTPPAAVDAYVEQRNCPEVEIGGLDPKDENLVLPLEGCIPSQEGRAKDHGSPSSINQCTRRKSVLKPCKVYKTPSSFSYRRLLPFLMDMEKERSFQTIKCLNREKDLEEKLPQHSLVSPSKQGSMNKAHEDVMQVGIASDISQGMPNDTHKEEIFFSEHQADSSLQHSLTQPPTDGSFDHNQSNSISQECQFGSIWLNGTYAGSALKVDHVQLDEPGNLDSGPDKLSPVAGSDQSDKTALELFMARDAVSVGQSPANLEDVVPSELPVEKGILKRNPRGCRGLCNCLDCTAFRLHAERAYEFSRNQLEAAEELALHLMKKLSELRNILGNSVGNAESHPIVPIHEVKEACMKACEAEEVARDRLSQMNEDLYVHCRMKALQRPKVNFASCIEEKMAAGKSRLRVKAATQQHCV